MLIVQISDSHIAAPAEHAADRAGDLRACVDYIMALDPLPDLAVHTGDISHNGKAAEYADAADILSALTMPLYVIPGNRDDRGALRSRFAQHLPADCHADFVQYAIDAPGHIMIMLDTVSTRSNKGRLCQARLDHLQEMLEAAGWRPVTIFMHHPPFDVLAAPDPFQFEDPGNVEALAQILSGHPNVRQIYCGHSHRAATGEIAGIAALTIPSIAEDLRKGPAVSLQTIAPNYRLK